MFWFRKSVAILPYIFAVTFCPALAVADPAPVHLLFAGDLMHHNAQERLARTCRAGLVQGYLDRWAGIVSAVAGADLAVGNLETPVDGGPVGAFPAFNARFEYLTAAARAGFDVLGFANNHSMDRGWRGFDVTMKNIESAGMQAMGDGAPYYRNVGGHRVGILTFTSLINAGSRFKVPQGRRGPYYVRFDNKEGRAGLVAKIAEMRAHADVVIVFVHWGNEYLHKPASWSRPWARELAAAGADVIVGHHPHVVGPTEWIEGEGGRRTFVAYSLGNFSSGMPQDTSPYGQILDVNIDVRGRISTGIRPVWTIHAGLNKEWATYRTIMASDLEADCAEQDAARLARLDRSSRDTRLASSSGPIPADAKAQSPSGPAVTPVSQPMSRTSASPTECARYRKAVKSIPAEFQPVR